MARGPRMTLQTQIVLRQALLEPGREWYGLEMMKATELPSGTIYPIITRLEQAGWITWYEPDVTVVHVKAGTSGQIRGVRLNFAFHYGMLRFYRKHYAASYSKARPTLSSRTASPATSA